MYVLMHMASLCQVDRQGGAARGLNHLGRLPVHQNDSTGQSQDDEGGEWKRV